jgi:hypothetical protein
VVLMWEGCVGRISLPFALLIGAIARYNVWIARFDIPFRRYLALVAAVVGYLTQLVGVSHGFRRYTAPHQSFLMVPFTFAAICLYGLITTRFERVFRTLHDYKPRWLICCWCSRSLPDYWHLSPSLSDNWATASGSITAC